MRGASLVGHDEGVRRTRHGRSVENALDQAGGRGRADDGPRGFRYY